VRGPAVQKKSGQSPTYKSNLGGSLSSTLLIPSRPVTLLNIDTSLIHREL
jgi:hypothetical protein